MSDLTRFRGDLSRALLAGLSRLPDSADIMALRQIAREIGQTPASQDKNHSASQPRPYSHRGSGMLYRSAETSPRLASG